MTKKITKNAKFYFLFFILLCALLVAPGFSEAAAKNMPQPTSQQQTQIAQLAKLEEILQQQALQLATARTILEKQEQQQTKLLQQLETAERQLDLCRQELKDAKTSLATASALIEKLQNLCAQLEKDLMTERAVSKKDKAKSNIKNLVIGILIGGAVGAVTSR